MDLLNRFLEAQEDMYDVALEEIKNGEKESHWMWYIFPQLRGLGRSPMAYKYGLDGIEEAKAYLAHPVLSARLIEISKTLLEHQGKDIEDIMGDIVHVVAGASVFGSSVTVSGRSSNSGLS